MVKLLYFARLREDVGCAQEDLALPAGVDTVARLRLHLMERGGAWKEAFGREGALRVAVNQDVARPTSAVQDGDEIAFFPPVTGG